MIEDDLATVQADFPGYRIWREVLPGRDRYVVRSMLPGLNPHTVVTDDLTELRDLLEPVSPPQTEAFTTARANIARMYAHWLGGKDSFAADRSAADSIASRFPEVVARQGVRQFVDFGAGLPDCPNVHEVARQLVPDARVVYVDHDPVVLSHARALLAADENVSVVAGDLRRPAVALADPALGEVMANGEPVCVILSCVLHFLTAVEADRAAAWFRRWMAPGSYLVISAGTSTGTDPELLRLLQAAIGDSAPVTGRAAGEIAAWFDGLAVARPGVVDVWAWRPGTVVRPVQARARILAGVGRKPAANGGPL